MSIYDPRRMVRYLLSWGAPADRLFDIDIRFLAPSDTPRLLLPAWRPGRYLIQNYAANVREWSAGEARIWKDGLTSWRVDARAGEEVSVRYRYYAGVLDAGSSFLDDDEAYFNGSNLFMLVDGLRHGEHFLTIAAPADWRIETQLARDESGTFRARDYDHLIDSPFIAAATMTRHSFVERDARFHLVFRGDDGIDTEQFIEPIRAIVRAQADLFGELPFREYRFLYHLRDRWHGVEHEDSCSIILRRLALLGAGPGDQGHDHTLSISAHELFHAWNVKRMLPAKFAPYDYWNATPTRLLWVMEGMTSYYGQLSLVRSGVWSVERYLRSLGNEIQTLESLPARQHLSLSQASFDGWLSDPTQRHDHSNAWFSFYNKGEVVAALLDLAIRRATDGERSLDDVVRFLWNGEKRLEEDALERAVAQIADVGDFFARYVDGTEPLPYEELFSAAGIGFAAAPREPESASLAMHVRSEDGLLIVDRVLRGGAGMEAGLLPGDELIALNETRITNEMVLQAALRGLKNGDAAELLIARAGVVKRLTLQVRPDPRPIITLKIESASELRRGWLEKES